MPREYKSPPEPGTARFRIQQLHQNESRKYAVFLRAPSGQSAKFKSLHETPEKALEVARFHASENASNGDTDFTYYVIEIKHRVGIENGKVIDKPMA